MLQVYSYFWNKSLQMLTNQYTKKKNILSIFHSKLSKLSSDLWFTSSMHEVHIILIAVLLSD